MTDAIEVHVYLAGPDVFYPDALKIGAEKKAKLAAVGLHGHFPFDNEIPKEAFQNLALAANTIANANEQMMLDCCAEGRIGVILANMTPYHGPSTDVGTGFEIGFMSALAATRNNVIIIGYTTDQRPFEERVIDDYYGGHQHTSERDGMLFGTDGNMIEAFRQADNLMLTNAIAKTGGRVVYSFEEAIQLAVELSDAMMCEKATAPGLHVNHRNSMLKKNM